MKTAKEYAKEVYELGATGKINESKAMAEEAKEKLGMASHAYAAYSAELFFLHTKAAGLDPMELMFPTDKK